MVSKSRKFLLFGKNTKKTKNESLSVLLGSDLNEWNRDSLEIVVEAFQINNSPNLVEESDYFQEDESEDDDNESVSEVESFVSSSVNNPSKITKSDLDPDYDDELDGQDPEAIKDIERRISNFSLDKSSLNSFAESEEEKEEELNQKKARSGIEFMRKKKKPQTSQASSKNSSRLQKSRRESIDEHQIEDEESRERTMSKIE